jgi:hypothetical protein
MSLLLVGSAEIRLQALQRIQMPLGAIEIAGVARGNGREIVQLPFRLLGKGGLRGSQGPGGIAAAKLPL